MCIEQPPALYDGLVNASHAVSLFEGAGRGGDSMTPLPTPRLERHVGRRERCGQRLREIRIGLAGVEPEPLPGIETQRLMHLAAADVLDAQPVDELRRGRWPGLLAGDLRLDRLI